MNLKLREAEPVKAGNIDFKNAETK